jgi:hypothetical protein
LAALLACMVPLHSYVRKLPPSPRPRDKRPSDDDLPPRGLLSGDVLDFTIEEVRKLQDTLSKLLRRANSKPGSRGSGATDDEGRAS